MTSIASNQSSVIKQIMRLLDLDPKNVSGFSLHASFDTVPILKVTKYIMETGETETKKYKLTWEELIEDVPEEEIEQ